MKTKTLGRRFSAASTLTSKLSYLLAALALVLSIAPGVASAHAHIVSSNPADGSTIQTGLTQMSIVYTEEISAEQSNAQLLGPDGAAVSGVTSEVDRAQRTNLNITTPTLAPGSYSIKWHAVTEDDNGITDGTITFTVAGGSSSSTTTTGAGTSTTSSGGATTLPVTGAGDQPLPTALLVAIAIACLATGIWANRRSRA